MLSGALLLNEEHRFTPSVFFRKSYLKMLLLTCGWTVFFALYFAFVLPAFEGKNGNLSEILDYILLFKDSDCPHLWYMYMILGLYLVIPVLRLIVKKENVKYVRWMIVACLLYHFTADSLNVLTVGKSQSLTAFLAKFHLKSATGFTGYLLLGWYLSVYRLSGLKLLLLLAAGALSLVLSILCVQFYIDDYPMIRDFVYQEPSLPALVYGCAIFSLVAYILKDRTYTTEHNILRMSADFTFGIFIIHVFYMELLFKSFMHYQQEYNPSVYILTLYAVTLLVSFATVYIISKIKPLGCIFYLK